MQGRQLATCRCHRPSTFRVARAPRHSSSQELVGLVSPTQFCAFALLPVVAAAALPLVVATTEFEQKALPTTPTMSVWQQRTAFVLLPEKRLALRSRRRQKRRSREAVHREGTMCWDPPSLLRHRRIEWRRGVPEKVSAVATHDPSHGAATLPRISIPFLLVAPAVARRLSFCPSWEGPQRRGKERGGEGGLEAGGGSQARVLSLTSLQKIHLGLLLRNWFKNREMVTNL